MWLYFLHLIIELHVVMIGLTIISLIYLHNNIDTLWGKNLSFGYKNEPWNISMMLLQYILQTNHALHHICGHLSTNKLFIFIHQIIPNRFIHIYICEYTSYILYIYTYQQAATLKSTMTGWCIYIQAALYQTANYIIQSKLSAAFIFTTFCLNYISMYPIWHALPIIHWTFSQPSFVIF